MFLSILSTYPWADDSPYLLKKRKEKNCQTFSDCVQKLRGKLWDE